MMFVLSDDDALEARIRDAAGSITPVQTLPMSTGARADQDGLGAVMIDGTSDLDGALTIATAFDELRPDVVVVLCARSGDGMLGRAMQAGVRDVFSPDDDDDRVREVVKRALEAADRRRAIRDAETASVNRTIMVMSPKGGAGKTTISTNLAVGLATRFPRQVVLVDADLQFGDVGNALRLLPETTVRDAIIGRLDDVTEVKINLTPHRSGLYVLAAPDLPGVADEISPSAFTRAVSLLSDDFRFVVVDTDPGLGERTLSVMDCATDLVFVAATDVASVRGLRKTLEALDHIGLTRQTRHFVLNRADAQVGLEVSDVADTIGVAPDVLVPSHRTMPISMNEGVPIIEGNLDSPARGPLWQLVDRFAPPPEDEQGHGREEHRGGFLRRRG